MSFTSTIEHHTQQSHLSGTILLSPSKKRKLTPEVEDEIPCEPTTLELWRWTFTQEAIAPCFINNVWGMKQSTGKGTPSDELSYSAIERTIRRGRFLLAWAGPMSNGSDCRTYSRCANFREADSIYEYVSQYRLFVFVSHGIYS